MKFEAVIFDCDGVLVDSEPLSNQVMAKLITEQGLTCTYEQAVAEYMGLHMDACIVHIEQKLGKPVSSDFHEQFKTRTLAAYRTHLDAIPGIREVLEYLNCPVAVASSAEHDELEVKLAVTGLAKFFGGNVFSVTDVVRGKPHPDIYLHAADAIGVDPSRCAVVEDTVTGATAGIAAGMTVFGYAGMTSPEKLEATGAQVIFSMEDLLENIVTNK